MSGPFRARRRRKLTVLAGARRRIQKLGPYTSMALLAVPLTLVEPLKLVALFVAGKGHWLAGTWMIVAAYAGSLLIVERLFRTVKPKLMLISWFATMWMWFVGLRDKVICIGTRHRVRNLAEIRGIEKRAPISTFNALRAQAPSFLGPPGFPASCQMATSQGVDGVDAAGDGGVEMAKSPVRNDSRRIRLP